jgi:Tfp pilus assembly protein PilF
MRFHVLAALVLAVSSFFMSCSRPEAARDRYISKGDQFFQEQKYEDASLNYRKAIQQDPQSGKAHYKLAISELQRRKWPEAYAALSRAVELNPQDEESIVTLADMLLTAYLTDQSRPIRFYEQLKKLSRQLETINPSSFEALRIKGYLALADRRPDEAITLFRRAHEIKPDDRDLAYGLTEALFYRGEDQEGEKLALQLTNQHTDFAPAYDLLYRHYLQKGRMNDADNVLIRKGSAFPGNAAVAMQLCVHYYNTNRRSESERCIGDLSDHPEAYPDIALEAGNFYASTGRPEEALKHFERGAQQNPQNQGVYEKRAAGILRSLGKLDQALAKLDRALQHQPDDAEALRSRAILLLDLNDPAGWATAERDLRTLVQKNPEDAQLHFELGGSLLRQRKTAEAVAEFKQAINHQKDFVNPRFPLAEISLAANRNREALAYAEEILALDPTSRRGRLIHIAALLQMREFAKARAELADYRKRYPNDPEAELQMAHVLLGEGKPAEAEAALRRLYRPKSPDVRPMLGLAESLAQQQRPDAAKALLKAGLESYSNPAQIHGIRAALAEIALKSRQFDDAIAEYKAILNDVPKASDLHVRLGEAYRAKGDFASARISFTKAAEIDAGNVIALAALASLDERDGQWKEAEKKYRQALKLAPGNPAIENNLAYLIARQGGDLEEALRLANGASRKEPGNPEFADTLGWVYVKRQMNDSAIQIFESLVRKHPKNSRYHYHLAVALRQKGNKEGARQHLEIALANSPSPEDEQAIRQMLAGLS